MTWPAIRRRAAAKNVHRVLVVDDHPLMRLGLRTALAGEAGLEVCGEAGNALEALELCRTTEPDLVIVDISLPGQSGLELIKHVRASFPRIRTLVWSMHDEELFAERALHAGAGGYVKKTAELDELLTAVRRVLGGKVHLSAAMQQRLLQTVFANAHEGTGVERLSDRELEVFEQIGQACTTKEIADRMGLSVKTIETYRENIKTKLGLDNSNELIRSAVEWTLLEA